uniref:Uncharacterized protein n=1 Tax=Anopheles culicifacies TaxID=139723 RepID=A0A182LVB3_9DIPT
MVTTIKITGDGVFIQSNGGVGGAGGGARLQQQQQLTADALGSTALGEANLPPADGPVHNRNGSLDTADNGGGNDTNNNHKGYRNFNHRRYQSDEGPGFIGTRNGKADRNGDGSAGSSEIASGESDDTIGDPDTTRKRDKFTISFLNTHRSSSLQNGGHGKSMLNHKFIVYNSKKPKTSSVLHQQYYQQSIAAAAGGDFGNGSGSPPLPMPYQSHYQQYLYNRLRPSLSTSVLSSPSLINGTAAELATPLGRAADQQDREQMEQQHQLYQNSLFHQQHRALLGTPPAAIPGWAKSTSCLVTDSVATTSSYRTVTASPLLLLPAQPAGSLPQTPRPVPTSSSLSSLSSSPSSFSAGSPPSSGANSSSNTPPPPASSEVTTPPNAAVLPSSTATTTANSSTPTTTSPVASKTSTSALDSTTASSTPTHSSSPPLPASNIGQ